MEVPRGHRGKGQRVSDEARRAQRRDPAKNIGKDNYDAVLVSEFETMDDLNAYKVDPRHVAVSDICKSIRADRVAVDYEF